MVEVPRADGAMQFSWVSFDGRWPGAQPAHLSQRLGEVRLAVSEQADPVDLLTGIGFVPVDHSSGYALEITQPRFQELKQF